MLNIELSYAVEDLDGNELLAAGTHLDEATLTAVAAAGRQVVQKTGCLLQHNNIRADLECFLNIDPYSSIFGGSGGIRKHLERIGEVLIPQQLLLAMDNFVDHDVATYRHSLIVFALSTFMMELLLTDRILPKNVLLVGPTHDLGKLFVPTNILRKKTPLTRNERALLEFHPIAGYVLSSYYLGDHQHPAAWVALNHHERRDGSGYPRGHSESNLLVEMVAACDVYDALISSRPYRDGSFDNRSALEELSSLAETGALNIRCVKTLIGRNRAEHLTPEQVHISNEKRGKPPINNSYGIIEDE